MSDKEQISILMNNLSKTIDELHKVKSELERIKGITEEQIEWVMHDINVSGQPWTWNTIAKAILSLIKGGA